MQPMQVRQHGQATLEFLILLPILLALIALVLMAGWWSYCKLAAQNAAYSYAVFLPTNRSTFHGSGSFGNFGAQYTVLATEQGMKPVWSFTLPHPYSSTGYAQSRIGGSGLTAGISSEGWNLAAYNQLTGNIGLSHPDRTYPRGTAFFLYTPLLGANPP